MNQITALLSDGKTLAEIGAVLGVSRQRVHQIVLKDPQANELLRLNAQSRKDAKDAKDAEKQLWLAQRKDTRCLRLFGMDHAKFARLKEMGVYKAYRAQRANACNRCIGWGFNLASWWAVWDASGKWAERGRGRGYVMARCGDSGPYEPRNVYICTQVQNMKDSYVFKPASTRNRAGVANAPANL